MKKLKRYVAKDGARIVGFVEVPHDVEPTAAELAHIKQFLIAFADKRKGGEKWETKDSLTT